MHVLDHMFCQHILLHRMKNLEIQWSDRQLLMAENGLNVLPQLKENKYMSDFVKGIP